MDLQKLLSQLETVKMLKGDPLAKSKTFQSLMVPKKVEKGTLLLSNGSVFHIRGFGCVHNQVLSTYRKSAPSTKSGPIRVRLTKTSPCNNRSLFLNRNAPTKNMNMGSTA